MDESGDVDIESLVNVVQNTTEKVLPSKKKQNDTTSSPTEKTKHVRLPLMRVKNIMKKDPDCDLISQDAIFLVAKATEMFLEKMSSESAKLTVTSKRKTVMKRDVDAVINKFPHLCFLDGAME